MDVNFRKQGELAKHPISICIVGHTNHGKTSTIRTLIENAHVGTVDQAPDTTTKVEGFRVSKHGLDRFYVYDTPGFTNLDARLAEHELERYRAPTIDELISSQMGKPHQADKWLYNTLRQIEKSHLIIQVLDSREDPSNETYLDEINFLKSCGVPLIVSLNFVHRPDTRFTEWEKVIRGLGVSNIIPFDAHTRTWEDEQDLFKCMRPLLCDPQHGKLHREFMDFWSDLRKNLSYEARMGAAENIRRLLVDIACHKTKVRFVNGGNRQEKEREAQDRFKVEIMEMVNAAFERILEQFGFSFDDVRKHQTHVDGGEGVLTMDFFDHSRLKYSATIAVAAATATVEAFFGFMTFGIPTLVAAAFGYFGASAWQMESEGEGTEITFKPTNAMLMLIASAALSLAKVLKSRGRADSHLIDVQLNQDVINRNSELGREILEVNKGKRRKTADLKKLLYDEIDK